MDAWRLISPEESERVSLTDGTRGLLHEPAGAVTAFGRGKPGRLGPARPKRSLVVSVAGPSVLPVAPHRRLTARQAALLEQVAADALHGGGLARRPDPPALPQGRPQHGVDEGGARRLPRRQLVP